MTEFELLSDDDDRCALLSIRAKDLRGRNPVIAKKDIDKARRQKIRVHLSKVISGDAAESDEIIERINKAADELIEYTKNFSNAQNANPDNWRNVKERKLAGLEDWERIKAEWAKPKLPPQRPLRSKLKSAASEATRKRRPLARRKPLVPDYEIFTNQGILAAVRGGQMLGKVAQEIDVRPYMASNIIDPLLRRVAKSKDGKFDLVLSKTIERASQYFTAQQVAAFYILGHIHNNKPNTARLNVIKQFAKDILTLREDLKEDVFALTAKGGEVYWPFVNKGVFNERLLIAAASEATGLNLFQLEKPYKRRSTPKPKVLAAG